MFLVKPKITKPEYEQYLQTDHWKEFSYKTKKKRGKCADCGIEALEAWKRDRQGLNVHHLSYENIGQEKDADVVVLCRYCHLKRHGTEGIYELAQKLAMPKASHGSQQACANCGVLNGPTYYNVDERLSEWLCADCRR